MSKQPSVYGGEVGDLLWSSITPTAAFTGFSVGFINIAMGFLMMRLGAETLGSFIVMVLASLFMVRIALNSAHGDRHGGLWTGSGSTWPECGAALLRVSVLNLIWFIPLAILGDGLSELPSKLMVGEGPGPLAPILVLGIMVLPPLCFVAGVAASSFSDLIDADHWRNLFAGRAPDLVSLLAVYVGGMMVTAGLAWFTALSMSGGKVKVLIALGVFALAYAFGVSFLLLGRLIGGFIRTGDEHYPEPMSGFDPDPFYDRAPLPTGVRAPESTKIFGLGPDAGIKPEPKADMAEVDDFPWAAAMEEPDDPSPATEAPAQPQATSEPQPKAEPRPQAAPQPQARAQQNRTPEARTTLSNDAATASVVDVLRNNARLAETDPAAALASIEEFLAARGPHPQVFARIAILEAEVRPETALQSAQEAVAYAKQLGNLTAVAELIEIFRADWNDLGLDAEDWVKLAQSQKSMGKLDRADELFRMLLSQDPKLLPAIKGLLQIADTHLSKDDEALMAVEIYDFLDQKCPGHPFDDFVDRGREQAGRKLHPAR